MRYLIYPLTFLVFLCSKPLMAAELLYKHTHWLDADKVVLQGLDKVSAKIFTAEVYVNQKVNFGSLEVYVRAAYKAPPEDPPESICFLEIFDNKPGQNRQRVFSGWMFASNPGLSALEHAVYDVWVKDTQVPPGAGLPELKFDDSVAEGQEKVGSAEDKLKS